MIRTKRALGATTVSIVWLVSILVLGIAAAVYGYVQMDNGTALTQAVQKAIDEAKSAKQELADLQERAQEVRSVIGFASEGDANDLPNPDTLRLAVDGLRGTFGDVITDEVQTLEQAVKAIEGAYKQKIDEVKQAVSDRTTASEARDEADRRVTELQRERDDNLASLRQELDNAIESAKATETNLQAQIDELRQRNDSLELAARDEREAAAKREAELLREIQNRDARILHLTQRAEELRKGSGLPDGKVIKVSDDGQVVFLDIGSKDGLVEGTRFDIYAETAGGNEVHKGWAKVTHVREQFSEAVVSNLVDPLKPVVFNDLVRNPMFQRGETYRFVLLGRFTGRYNKSEIRYVLEQDGHKVEDAVGTETDFLVLGEPPLPEEGGSPIDLMATPEYRNALILGVHVLREDDLYRFLR